MLNTEKTAHVTIILLNYYFLHKLEYLSNCKLSLNIMLKKDLSITKETKPMKTSPKLHLATLALMNQYLAFVLCMILLGVVYSYVHLLLMKSKIKFVLDFSQLVILNELWNICLQYTVFYYLSLKVIFLLYLIDLNMVNPE
jgi:hypothetical protein